MSFPEAVKQVLFGGWWPSGFGGGHVPRSRRTGACCQTGPSFFFLPCFFPFVSFLFFASWSLVPGLGVPILPCGPVASSLICAGGLAIGGVLSCHLDRPLSGDGGGGYAVEEAIGFPVGIGRCAGRRFEPERGVRQGGQQESWRALPRREAVWRM